MASGFYLPEYNDFEYSAVVPWPVDPRHLQADWIHAINTIESWLEQYVGPHLVEWAFDGQREQEPWQACIAFRQERDRTLFVLCWA